ncbi:hypothetical protein [Streptomyces sp. NPDC018352]|uniref:hypothetical protein n=1 Tax=Streptomyces sp. NPDC018352 TaxID=3157194 RepID=UPI0033E2BA6E
MGVLHNALDALEELHEQWLATLDGLPSNARSGNPAFEDALAEHHAESWGYLDDWASNAQALREINSAALTAPSPLAPPPTTAPAPVAGRQTPVRR